MFFIFCFNYVTQYFFNFSCTHFFAAIGLQALTKEKFKPVSTKLRLHKFAVGNTAYCRNIKIGLFCNMFQYHRPQIRFITRNKKCTLVIHNGFHGIQQGIVPLFNGINKPFGGINLLLNEDDRFFLPFIFFTSAVIFFQHVTVSLTYTEIRGIFIIKCQLKFAGIVINKKVGHYVAFCPATFAN